MPTRVAFPPDTPWSNQVAIAGIDVDPRAVIIEVRGLKTGVNLDIKEAAGQNGAFITYQGRKFARFSIEFRAGHESPGYDAAEGYKLIVGLAELAYNSGGGIVKGGTSGGVTTTSRAATPVGIRHPLLAIAGVNAMVIEDINWPEEQDDKSYVMTWDCIQYAPPQKVNVNKPLQGDVLNDVPDTFSGAKGAAPASLTSPQLPAPPPPSPGTTKPKP
jgi:hypothetical protein